MCVIFHELIVLRQNLTRMDKLVNAEFAKLVKKNLESKKTQIEKYKSRENWYPLKLT